MPTLYEFISKDKSLEMGRESINKALTHYIDVSDESLIPKVSGLTRIITKDDITSLYLYINNSWNKLCDINNNFIPAQKLFYNPKSTDTLYNSNYPEDSIIVRGKLTSYSTDINSSDYFIIENVRIKNLYADNITVLGNVNQIDVDVLNVKDNKIILNSGLTGNNDESSIGDAGIEVNRGDLAKSYIIWDEVSNKWKIKDGNGEFYLFQSKVSEYYNFNTFEFKVVTPSNTITIPSEIKYILTEKNNVKIYLNGTLIDKSKYDINGYRNILFYFNLVKDDIITVDCGFFYDSIYKTPVKLEPIIKTKILSTTKTYVIPKIDTSTVLEKDKLTFLVYVNKQIFTTPDDYSIIYDPINDNYTITFVNDLVSNDNLIVYKAINETSHNIKDVNHIEFINSGTDDVYIRVNRGTGNNNSYIKWDETNNTWKLSNGDSEYEINNSQFIKNLNISIIPTDGQTDINLLDHVTANDLNNDKLVCLVFKNGSLLYINKNYVISNGKIILNTPLATTDNVNVIIGVSFSNECYNIKSNKETFDIQNTTNYIILKNIISPYHDNVQVFVNGLLKTKDVDYIIEANNKISFTSNLTTNTKVVVYSEHRFSNYTKANSYFNFDISNNEAIVLHVSRENGKYASIKWSETSKEWLYTNDGVIWSSLDKSSNTIPQTLNFVATASQTVFDLSSYDIKDYNSCVVFVNGLFQPSPSKYSINIATKELIFINPLNLNDVVNLVYGNVIYDSFALKNKDEYINISKNVNETNSVTFSEIQYDDLNTYCVFLNGVLCYDVSKINDSGKLKLLFGTNKTGTINIIGTKLLTQNIFNNRFDDLDYRSYEYNISINQTTSKIDTTINKDKVKDIIIYDNGVRLSRDKYKWYPNYNTNCITIEFNPILSVDGITILEHNIIVTAIDYFGGISLNESSLRFIPPDGANDTTNYKSDVIIKRTKFGEKDVTFGWNELENRWEYTNDGVNNVPFPNIYYSTTFPDLKTGEKALLIKEDTGEIYYHYNSWNKLIGDNTTPAKNYTEIVYKYTAIGDEVNIDISSFVTDKIISYFKVYIDGIFMNETEDYVYNSTNKIITFTSPLNAGEKITILAQYLV